MGASNIDCYINTHSHAHTKPTLRNGAMDPQKVQRLDSSIHRLGNQQCWVGVLHYRYRLADADGLSTKAVVDAIVRAGILEDDTTQCVGEVRHRQIKISKAENEKTVIAMGSYDEIELFLGFNRFANE